MPTMLTEPAEITEAVTNEIKRRRKPTKSSELPITLDERRALDKANVTRILKEYKSLVINWDDIMSSLL